jgi:predicted ABC-type ATPase
LSRELKIAPYAAAEMADSLRRELISQRESSIFETVFSDPVGNKLTFLQNAAAVGYTVALCFIGLSGPKISEQRVAMRVTQGGQDVPMEKLETIYPRILANLTAALRELPYVWIFDNDDLCSPFRLVAVYENGRPVQWNKPIPRWLRAAVAK